MQKSSKSLIVVKSFHSPVQIAVNGSTGPIHFDQNGTRDSFYIEVVNNELDNNKYGQVIARYECPSINNSNCDTNSTKVGGADNVQYFTTSNSTSGVKASSIKGQNVIVIMKLGEPFLKLK